MNYEIEYTKKARKFLERRETCQPKRVIRAINKLPLEGDIKKLKGLRETFRLRVGDFRILYQLHEKTIVLVSIIIIDIDNRGDVYK